MKKLFPAAVLLLFFGLLAFTWKTQAAQLEPVVSSTDGSDCLSLTDDDYMSTEPFEAGTVITLQTNENIDSVYIKWDSIPGEWKLRDGASETVCGKEGFLHEFVKLSGSSNTVSIEIPGGGATIADVYAFSGGALPDFVQQWEPSWDRADILCISTHSDDEILFLGGVIPTYINENRARVQIAYFCDFFLTESYRNHELLDGLWTMGVDHYPQLGKFPDNYSESLEEAESQYDHEQCLEYIIETIRRFKPQVLVTQDENGEYGHGCHRLVSLLVREAVEKTADASSAPSSAQKYGTWDVPKTYLHLYSQNKLEVHTRTPLSSFGGQNALEITKAAYLKHNSQQWMDFIVDDGYDENGQPNDYQYGNGKFGLYRSLVGEDTGLNDMLEHIVTYDVQEAEPVTAEPEEPTEPAENKTEKKANSGLIIVLIILAVLVIAVFTICMIIRSKRKAAQKRPVRRSSGGSSGRSPSGSRGGTPQQRSSSGSRSGTPQQRSSSGSRSGTPQQRSSSGSRSGTPQQRSSSGSRSGTPQQRSSSGSRSGTPQQRSSSGSRSGMPQQRASSGNRSSAPQQRYSPDSRTSGRRYPEEDPYRRR